MRFGTVFAKWCMLVIKKYSRMKILTENLSDLEREMIEQDLIHEDITEVNTKEEAYNAIENHFGTLKCNSNDHDTDKGELWIVFPPRGVYGESLNILIKE